MTSIVRHRAIRPHRDRRRDARGGRGHRPGSPVDRRRSRTWSDTFTPTTVPPTAVQANQPAPAQRAAADRRRTRPAGAGHLDSGFIVSVIVGSWRLLPNRRRCARSRPPALSRRGRDAGRRHVRVQLRRLRVPDAVSGPGHAAVRGSRGDRERDEGACASVLAAERARGLIDDFSRRTVLVVGDVMLDRFIVGRVTPHFAGSAGPGGRSRSRRAPARRRRQRRAQHRRAGRRRSAGGRGWRRR